MEELREAFPLLLELGAQFVQAFQRPPGVRGGRHLSTGGQGATLADGFEGSVGAVCSALPHCLVSDGHSLRRLQRPQAAVLSVTGQGLEDLFVVLGDAPEGRTADAQTGRHIARLHEDLPLTAHRPTVPQGWRSGARAALPRVGRALENLGHIFAYYRGHLYLYAIIKRIRHYTLVLYN